MKLIIGDKRKIFIFLSQRNLEALLTQLMLMKRGDRPRPALMKQLPEADLFIIPEDNESHYQNMKPGVMAQQTEIMMKDISEGIRCTMNQ